MVEQLSVDRLRCQLHAALQSLKVFVSAHPMLFVVFLDRFPIELEEVPEGGQMTRYSPTQKYLEERVNGSD